MKKSMMKIILVMLLFLIESNSLNAQSLIDLEKRYDQLNNQFDKENKILDSLKNIFAFRTAQIDNEKKKKNSDNDKIINLMAGSVQISNKIETQNKRIDRIKTDIEGVKNNLHKIYVSKIDSLESLKKTGDEDKIDAEILLITEKNILVAPRILSLSFNPEKILEIDLTKTPDPKEKTLYKEYLDNALSEVNILLKSVGEQVSEVNQIVALQTKTKKFLEDTELESNMVIRSQRDVNSEVSSATRPGLTENSGITGTSSDFVSNIRTYQLILRQLDIQQLSKTNLKFKISIEEMDRNLDVKEYQRLLMEVQDRLLEFKLVLANKIGPSK